MFCAALPLWAGQPESLDALARMEFQRGNYRAAAKYWERVATAGHPAALYNLGLAYQALGSMSRAEQMFTRALVEWPAEGQVWHALGQVQYARRAYSRAERS